MILSLRKARQRLKFIVLFIVLTFVLYHMLSLLAVWLQPQQRYREPFGRAEKVFQHEAMEDQKISVKQRLLQFYWYGE
jgi:Na+-transporting NADH:ubiquinone oxidoreductase subunit NqrC